MKKEDFYDKYILREGDLLPERIEDCIDRIRLYSVEFFKHLQDKGLVFDNLEAAQVHYRCIMGSMKMSPDERMLHRQTNEDQKVRKRIYISGPISGHDIEERREAFEYAQTLLESWDYEPVNPMKNGLPDEATTHEHMKRDIELLMTCDYIYMMRRWTHSKGCKVEFDVATAIGLPVLFEESSELIKFE